MGALLKYRILKDKILIMIEHILVIMLYFLDSFNLDPGCLLGSWAISVLHQRPALQLPSKGCYGGQSAIYMADP